MSLFNSIKRVLGFGDDDIEEEIGIDATVTPINATRQMARDDAQADDDSDSDHLDASAATEEELPSIAPDEIFEHVLKIFNESLPTFIKESIDTEAQRKYLYETLDQSIKTHLSEVQNRLAEQMERRKRFEMDQLRKQLHEAGEKAKKTEESSGEWKKQQLSAERQKRALAERVHDLENKINELQAEREQFELENKSLVNKIRVYSVQENDMDHLRDEVTSLRKQLLEARNGGGEAPDADSDQLVTMQSELESLRSKLAEAEQKLADAENHVSVSPQEMEQIQMKQNMSDSMINDLNRTASELRQQLSAEQQHVAELNAQLEKAHMEHSQDSATIVGYEKELNEMTKKMTLLSQELQSTQSELNDANENLALIDQIQQQIEKLDAVINKKNERIKDLQAEIESLQNRIATRDNEIASLKKTIESNLMSQAQSETELQKTIDSLKDQLSRQPKQPSVDTPDHLDLPPVMEKPRRRGRKAASQVKISAIDDSLESTDWLVAAPPAGTPPLPGVTPESEFGYKEPSHKNPPENDAQMSLW